MERMKDVVVVLFGIAAALYLVYPSAGIFELIPDAIPFVGSVDEATATTILLAAFRYFGHDIAHLFKRHNENTVVTPR
jgi:uncharacterized membrane protein YkvA (DUF1232 family)